MPKFPAIRQYYWFRMHHGRITVRALKFQLGEYDPRFGGLHSTLAFSPYQGRSQDFREGGADVCACEAHTQIWPHPLMKWKDQSSNYHRECVLNVASELESRFLTEFWDKISFWLSSTLYFYSSWWFGIAKGVLDEAVLWTMLTRPRAEGGARAPWAPPLATPLTILSPLPIPKHLLTP